MVDNEDDADSRYLSRVLSGRALTESQSTHHEFVQLQMTAANEGEVLPPSTLRALIHAAAESDDADGLSPLRTPASAGPAARGGVRWPAGAAAASSAAASEAAENEVPSLLRLPDCVLLLILGACDAATLVRLAVVSRELATLAASIEQQLWRHLVEERYSPISWALPPNSLTPSSEQQSWKALYTQLAGAGAGSWRTLAAAAHTTDASCWLVIGTRIFDVTEFLHRHPGGVASLRLFAGDDATEAFGEVPHSAVAHRLMRSLEVAGLRLPHEAFPPRLAPSTPQLEATAAALLPPLPSLSDQLEKLHLQLPSLSHQFEKLPSISDQFEKLPSISDQFEKLPSIPDQFREKLPSLPALPSSLSARFRLERLTHRIGQFKTWVAG